MSIEIVTASLNDVDRLRALRLAALKDTPAAFGAKYDDEVNKSISEWSDRLKIPLGVLSLQMVLILDYLR